MKRTKLKRVSSTQAIKLRIQKLLRAILIAKSEWIEISLFNCAFKNFQAESVKCSGSLQCDHKFSRRYNSTFADFKNLHLLCKAHNLWKHRHGVEARSFIDKLYGKRKMDALQKKAHQSCPMDKKSWLNLEAELKTKLEKLER